MRWAPAAVLLGAVCVSWLGGCTGDDSRPAPDETPAAPAPPSAAPTPPVAGTNEYCELALFYRQEFEKLRNRFGETDPAVITARELAESAEANCSNLAVAAGTKSGKWVEKDGVLTCDGYMTRRDDQDFCSAEVPDDWVPFEYDGEIYFLQPLQGNAELGVGSLPPPPAERK